MQISASLRSTLNKNVVSVITDDTAQGVTLPAKATGLGSAINGANCSCSRSLSAFAMTSIEKQKKEI
jgi:hypothetical protein